MSIVPAPKIPNPGGGLLLYFIINAAKKLISVFGKKAKPINNDSSVSDIEEVTKVFEGFKRIVKEKTDTIEKKAAEEIQFYIDELHQLLDQHVEMTSKYRINVTRLNRSIGRLPSNINGVIDATISKKVSLDNPKCKEVLKMLPGAKKEEALKELMSSAVNDGLQECCAQLHYNLSEIYEDAESEILGTIDSLQQQINAAKKSLDSVDETNYQETAKKQITNSYYLIDVCDLVEKTL